MLEKKTTIKDIAEVLNVTPSTVSRALNDHPKINKKTKIAVRKTALDLNYMPNNLASALRRGSTELIGVVVPRIDRAFFSSIMRGIEDVALAQGFNVLIAQSNEDIHRERSVINSFLNARVAGIFASLGKNTTDFSHYIEAQKRGIPLIQFDRTSNDINSAQTVIDDYRGGFEATDHLIKMGCRKIAHLTSGQNSNIYIERKRGYIDALKKANIKIDHRLIITGDMLESQGVMAVNNQLKSLEYDAIFSASDYAAMGAIKALKTIGKLVPNDVCVVGFSNEPFTDLIEPSLTTVNQFPEEMGRKTAETFFSQLNGESKMPHKIVLQPELIIRQSSSKII